MKGSVRKRGKTWYYTVDLPRINGKRKQKTKGGFKTKKEAEKALALVLADIERGEYIIEDKKVTLNELIRDWLNFQKWRVKPTTHYIYVRLFKTHIQNGIGRCKISEIKPINITRYYQDLVDFLSPSTIKLIHRVINGSFAWAVKMEMLNRNPAQGLELPRKKRSGLTIWTKEEVNRFLSVAKKESVYYPIYYLAITTGMRRGEILGLKWQDIDFEQGVINIQRSWTTTGKEAILTDTKTNFSARSINISKNVIEILKAHRKKQEEHLKLLGIKTDFVFVNRNGNLIRHNNLWRSFKTMQEKAGVPLIRFHDLRHIHASILLQKGVHPKIVSERLGHSSIKITLDIYSHLVPGMQKQAADAIDDFLA
jgi:integrase